MARPKTMNAAFGDFISAVMDRFNQLLQQPDWVPSEAQATVLKRLAETQVILQKGKPGEENGRPATAKEREGMIEALEASPPPSAAAADVEHEPGP